MGGEQQMCHEQLCPKCKTNCRGGIGRHASGIFVPLLIYELFKMIIHNREKKRRSRKGNTHLRAKDKTRPYKTNSANSNGGGPKSERIQSSEFHANNHVQYQSEEKLILLKGK